MRSYFKGPNGKLQFFDDGDLKSIRTAYDRSQATSVYTVPRISGPWDRVAIIGHRSRRQILADLIMYPSDESLYDELTAISERYNEVDRVAPPTVVAA